MTDDTAQIEREEQDEPLPAMPDEQQEPERWTFDQQ
jgi:hypothetical protein